MKIASKRHKIKRMSSFISKARDEKARYVKNKKKITSLQQSANKLWNAYIYMLEAVTESEIKAGGPSIIRTIAIRTEDNSIISLFDKVAQLHIYYYEDELFRPPVMVNLIDKSLKQFTVVRKKHKLY